MDITRLALTSMAIASSFFGATQAATVPSVFNTGVAATGLPLAAGASDPHWTTISGPGITGPVNAVVVNAQSPLGSYFGTSDSRWIWFDANSGYDVGLNQPYTFRLSFDLTGFDPATASLRGAWGADNLASLLLNGQAPVGTGSFSSSGFGSAASFDITGGFHSGINTLDVVATNVGAWGAFNMTSLVGNAAPVPEVSSMALFLAGLGGLSVAMRSRRPVSRLKILH